MKAEALQKAVALSEKLQHVFVATADDRGLPHVAAAGKLEHISDDRVAAAAWFCPTTSQNLQQNRPVSLVVWEKPADTGYQLLGEVEKVEQVAMMDGYAPELESAPPPQVERRLTARIDKVIAFSHAPHADVEE